MNYQKYLTEEPVFSGLPRNFVIMRNTSGEEKVLHVDNRRLDGPVTGGPESKIIAAIKDYFKLNNKTISAEIYVIEKENEKKLIKSIKNT